MLRISVASVFSVCAIAICTLSVVGDDPPADDWTRFEVMQCDNASDIVVPPIATFQDDQGNNVVLISWDIGCDIFINGEDCDITYLANDEWGRPIFCGLQVSTGLECLWMFDCDGNGGVMEEVQLGAEVILNATRTIFSAAAPRKRKCVCSGQANIWICSAAECDHNSRCQGSTNIEHRCIWVEVQP